MSAYYNENDPKAAAWLRELIRENLIAPGEVDERSIEDVDPNDLDGFTQCHFFAGIGGWSYALRLAGWPDNREVWTGICPCQPLSCAGQRKGHADKRHLWPAFYRLIAECKPATVFGEQVASKYGREWLAGVRADLEGIGYAIGCADLCAASVGSPHRRQRLFWMANADRRGSQERRAKNDGALRAAFVNGRTSANFGAATPQSGAGVGALAEADGRQEQSAATRRLHAESSGSGAANELGDTESGGRGVERDAALARSGRHLECAIWTRFEIVQCRDGKARRFEPESFPLADGLPGRVALLRGYGNAIVPQVAAEFIIAAEEALAEK